MGGQNAEDQERDHEVADGKNDSIKKAENGKERDVIHRRTKAQYVIY
jgi:hypothetical protein